VSADGFPPPRFRDILGDLERQAEEIIHKEGTPTDESETRRTQRWYAAESLAWVKEIRSAISVGDADHMALCAFHLGQEQKEQDIRFGYVKNQTQGAGRKRGEAIASEAARLQLEIREKASQIKQKLSKRGKARLLQKKEFPGMTAEAIRKIL
jgi:hypothetical protein